MINFKTFIFSPFQENTYVIWDETKQCIIVDAGNFFPNENEQLDAFFKEKQLKPVQLVNTHNHLDHVFGTRYLADTYNLKLVSHPADNFWIENFMDTAEGYGLTGIQQPPKPEVELTEDKPYKFGNTALEVIHVPGHSPGGVALHHPGQKLLFCGDILFQGSIGRTDLPGGNHDDLINGIKAKLLPLPDDTRVFSGHGPETSIGFERANNPFLT